MLLSQLVSVRRAFLSVGSALSCPSLSHSLSHTELLSRLSVSLCLAVSVTVSACLCLSLESLLSLSLSPLPPLYFLTHSLTHSISVAHPCLSLSLSLSRSLSLARARALSLSFSLLAAHPCLDFFQS